MEFMIVFIIPELLLFDLIPKIFGFKGLMEWYENKYKDRPDIILATYCLISIGLLIFIALTLKK